MLLSEVNTLVVEDVNAMRAQIKELLRGFGFRNPTAANNGEDAKQVLAEGEYQLILADWHMSPTGGMDLLQWVRSQEKHKTTPFIMITAEGSKEMVIQCIKGGVDDYIVKPLMKTHLEAKIYNLLLKKGIL
jgi:two-component system chemotaxis response regulator CheY